MLKKIAGFLKKYGVSYTIKKIIRKLYILYILGPTKVNRKISKKEREEQEMHRFLHPCRFSIVVPLYNTPEHFLRQMLDSVLSQTYQNWQLCLADASDMQHAYIQTICEEYARKDSRICYRKLDKNYGISENTNVCIEMSDGDYIALFDHDDLLHPSALFEVMKCIEEKKADVIYTDEATFQGRETRLLNVHNKPDFHMENLRANNYICHFTVFQKELLKQTGTFRKEFDGSQDHDLILRLCEAAGTICHIPKVLYFWRAHKNSVALAIDSKNYAVDAGRRAVQSHLARCGIPAEVTVSEGAMSIYQVTYDCGERDASDITVLSEEKYKNTGKTISELVQDAGGYILLLKEGLLLPEKQDLEQMRMHMAEKEVAAVTGKIVSQRGKILSGGVEIEAGNGQYYVRHLFAGVPVSDSGYMNQLMYASGIPVICNGCMLVRKEHVLAALKQNWNLFDMKDWVTWSLYLRKHGFELINEARTFIIANRPLRWYNKKSYVDF